MNKEIIDTTFTNDLSKEIFNTTYKISNETSYSDLIERVALASSGVEKKELQDEVYTNFKWLFSDFKFIPGGRILSNIGVKERTKTTLFNCFSKNAKVYTQTGYKNINKVQVGEMVLTHNNRFRRVNNVMSRSYVGELNKIEGSFFYDGIECSDEHPFLTRTGWAYASELTEITCPKIKLESTEFQSFDIYEYVHQKFGSRLRYDNEYLWTETNTIGGNGCKMHFVSEKIRRKFVINDEISYFLGRFIGDGCTFQSSATKYKYDQVDSFNVVFSKVELSACERLQKTLLDNFGISTSNDYTDNKSFFYISKYTPIFSYFLQAIIGEKSYNKNIPQFIFNSPKSIIEQFILGIIDSDGCITQNTSMSLVLNNKKLIEDVSILLFSLNIPNKVFKVSPSPNCKYADKIYYKVHIPSEFTQLIIRKIKKIYIDDRLLDETYRKSKDVIIDEDRVFNIKIKNSKIKFDGLLYNLSVEDDQSYVVNNAVVHNCYVHTPLDIKLEDCDSISGIYDMLKYQALTLKSEGGYGTNFSWIRPKGSYIEGIGARTPGVLRFMELWDKSSDIITSGSESILGERRKEEKKKIRKGAQMAILWCWHPEIEEYITAKQTQGRLTKFNMSVGIWDGFMSAVENDEDWNLVFPDTNHPKYKKEWFGNLFDWKSKGYPVIVHKTLKARYLWNKIMESTYKRAEPGVLFFDIINKLNPLAYAEHVQASNPCQPAWAKVLSQDGWKDFGDIVIGEKIWSTEGWTTVIKKWSTGIKKVYRYNLENGCVFNGTKNHKIIQNGIKIEVDDAEFIDSFIEGKSSDNWDRTDRRTKKTIPTKIVSREYVSEEEVFDITVNNKSHTYWTQGCNVSNCAEIVMSTGVCNLGSLNLSKFVILKGDTYTFDFDTFKTAVKYGIRFLDNVNDLSTTPLPEYDVSVKEKRRIGLGTFGLGSLHYILGLKFASEESLLLIKKIFKIKCEQELIASAELGKEKGSFILFDKKKYFDSYWWKNLKISSEVKEQVEKIGAMRNSHRSMNAPTGNTATLCNNTSSGIEPVFMKEYVRWNIVNEMERGELRKRGFNFSDITIGEWKESDMMKFSMRGDEQILKGEFEGVKYEIDKNRGLVKSNLIEDFGWKCAKEIYKNKLEELEKAGVFVTTEHLTVDDHLNTLAIIAHYTDQACSKTVNVPNAYPFDRFKDVYMKAWKNNIKGITTYREGTMAVVLEANKPITGKNSNQIVETSAPKRPVELPCDVYHVTCDKEDYYVVVGKMNSPYEVFTGLNHYRNQEIIPKHIKDGKIIKEGKKKYVFQYENSKILLTNGHIDYNRDSLTRLISSNLRHGVPLNFVVEQLSKNEGDMFVFSKIIGRVLKKYIKDGAKAGICPNCGNNMEYKSKCPSCPSCGYSACS